MSAYFLVTTGYNWPLTGCAPQLASPYALFLARVRTALAVGFIVAALRNADGPEVKDPLLVGMMLALASSLLLHGGAYTLVSGIARFGRTQCLEVGPPLSYGIGALAIGIGTLALYAAVITLR
jgi:hypothetical protein